MTGGTLPDDFRDLPTERPAPPDHPCPNCAGPTVTTTATNRYQDDEGEWHTRTFDRQACTHCERPFTLDDPHEATAITTPAPPGPEVEQVPPTERTLAIGRLVSAVEQLVAGRDTAAIANVRAALALVDGGLDTPGLQAEVDRIRAHADPATVARFDELVGAAT